MEDSEGAPNAGRRRPDTEAVDVLLLSVAEASEQASATLRLLNPHETLDLAGRLELALRRLTALAVRVAGEVEQKTIAAHVGARSTVSLLQERLRISPAEAKRRLALAAAFHPGTSLTGEPLTSEWPGAAEAFRDGRISADHARVLCQNLAVISDRARTLNRDSRLAADGPESPEETPWEGSPDNGPDGTAGEIAAAAERHLLRQALDFDPTFVERCGKRWVDYLDPDGCPPTEAETLRYHGLFFGRPRTSGLVPFRGAMTQEQHEILLTAIQPATNPRHCGGGEEVSGDPAGTDHANTDLRARPVPTGAPKTTFPASRTETHETSTHGPISTSSSMASSGSPSPR